MTIGTPDLELIKKDVAGIPDFYNARINADIPPLKEESGRIAAQVATVQEMWGQGEKDAILAKYGGRERPRVPYGKYQGLDLLDLAYMRSLLNTQMRKPLGLNPHMLEDWQANLKAAMDSTTAGTGDETSWSPPRRPPPCGWT